MKEITKIRKAVTILANRLNNKIKDLSSAFKKAWQIVRGKILLSKVDGTTFNNRQKALSHLAKYNPKTINVELLREPNNQYDNNA